MPPEKPKQTAKKAGKGRLDSFNPEVIRKPRYSHEEKMEIVQKIGQMHQNGMTIFEAANKLGICERSFQRWREALEEKEIYKR